jgi:threonine dehydratase
VHESIIANSKMAAKERADIVLPSWVCYNSFMMQPPTFLDVLKARQIVAQYLPRTPLHNYPALDQAVGTQVFVKHENYQPIGAFKVRGGINLISQLSPGERARGVIAASTGNHGQSVTFAAHLFQVPATIVVPEGANPVKVEAMRSHGANIILYGQDFDEAREHCERLAKERELRYVHSGNEPLLIAGVATETLEILEDLPDVDVILVPIGGGSGAAGTCIAAKTLNPRIRVVGVQSRAAPAAFRSWQSKSLVTDKTETFAEGLATRSAFALPQQILWELLDEFVLVDDDAIRRAIVLYLEKAKTLAEAAGAAPLAAALSMRDQVAGKKVGLILSGGNITPEQLKQVLAA